MRSRYSFSQFVGTVMPSSPRAEGAGHEGEVLPPEHRNAMWALERILRIRMLTGNHRFHVL
jgi:hypothetical protein